MILTAGILLVAGFIGLAPNVAQADRNACTRLLLFVAAAGFLGYWLILRATPRRLDRGSATPGHIQAALDAMTEGVILLDEHGQIVLANAAFAAHLGLSPDELRGRAASELPWRHADGDSPAGALPWTRAYEQGRVIRGAALSLDTPSGLRRTFRVNATPVLAADGSKRGATATFEDVSRLQRKNARFRKMLGLLKKSRQEVELRNRQLQELATIDPLTGCINRRSFYESLDGQWSLAERHGRRLACAMLDVDNFKRINDEHGHTFGDHVLQRVATKLQSMMRRGELLCRYGGEEFCILLAEADLEQAARAAERFRQGIMGQDYSGVTVTASFGVSAMEAGPRTAQELVDQADQALYLAKQSGRNCVVRWDRARQGRPAEPARAPSTAAASRLSPHAVNALLSALGHRDAATAEHCQHVATLCVSTAEGLMPDEDIRLLEVAAKVHEVGRLGMPDTILQKPGRLSQEEFMIFRRHWRVGLDIISSTFACPALTGMVRCSRAWYDGSNGETDLPKGKSIPLGARILCLANAFSAMVHDRPYRPAMSRPEALDELRKASGTQFDPDLIPVFVRGVLGPSSDHDGVAAEAVAAVEEIRQAVCDLSQAADEKNLQALRGLAQHLADAAKTHGDAALADKATALAEAAIGERPNLERVAALADELSKACRVNEPSQNPSATSADPVARHASPDSDGQSANSSEPA